MPPENRDAAYLWDMREASRLIIGFLGNKTYNQYNQDKLVQSAVERQLEIIGEAARRVSPGYQQAHPELPWRNMVGLRNILTHEYGEIKQDRIWNIAKIDVPKLVEILDNLIPPIE
jgi:uncharacterized protein with HEPN domain